MKPIRLFSHFYPFHSTYITKPNSSNSKVLSSIQFFHFPSSFLNFLGYQTESKETNKTWTTKRISISKKISSGTESNHKNKSVEITKPNQQTEKTIKLHKSIIFLYIIHFSLLFSATKHILNSMQLQFARTNTILPRSTQQIQLKRTV